MSRKARRYQTEGADVTNELTGRVAVVTGAGRGIGRSIAIGLAGAGAELVLASRSAEDLEAVRTTIVGSGGSAHVIPTDISTVEGVEHLRDAVSEIGWPSILVNAAGVFGPMQLIVDTDPVEWMKTVQVNAFGAYLTCRAFAPEMVKAKWGRILNVTSAAVLHKPGPFNSAYATSKATLNQFTRHLAAELTGTGVTANVFHPGDVKTEMWAAIKDQVALLGDAAAANYGPWVEWVERTGGDPPQKAVDLVLRVVTDDHDKPNGQFLWIDEPLQPAVPSWSVDDDDAPSYVEA